MEYRKVGTSGLWVSVISLGAWLTYGTDDVSDDNATACIRRAIERGINYIDVADAYSNGQAEEVVGRAIRDYKRSDLVISTKAFWPMSDNINDAGLSRKHITESVNKSLKRFGTDYIDMFFCHRYDDNTPVEETVRAIEDLIHQGKLLYWGTSMWNGAQIYEAVSTARQINANRPVVEQPEYNMLDRALVEGMLEESVAKNGMGLVVWSPLTGKYNNGIPKDSRLTQRDIPADRLEKARDLTALAQQIGTTPAALAIAWVLKNPVVASAITGATRPEQVDENLKPEQVDENLKALDVNITPDIDARIESILNNKPEYSKHNG
jgi:voltage-dependent potassium channel beta subunit